MAVYTVLTNIRMKENDIKYRMIRQSIPETSRWADTTYHKIPVEIENIVIRLVRSSTK